jgi:hypothetical protein
MTLSCSKYVNQQIRPPLAAPVAAIYPVPALDSFQLNVFKEA